MKMMNSLSTSTRCLLFAVLTTIVMVFTGGWTNRFASAESTFNLQIIERVSERVDDFMAAPVQLADRAELMRQIGGFSNRMQPPDRDELFKFLYIDKPSTLYYGLEDGSFMIYNPERTAVSYREPGESGYDAVNVPKDKLKYFDQCVDPYNGTSKKCLMENGFEYIQCINDCELVPCQSLTTNCSSVNNMCYENTTTWCRNYQTRTMSPDDPPLGFIPRSRSCIDANGTPSEALGQIVTAAFPTMEFGNCYYEDGITLVNRNVSGPYAHCQRYDMEGEEICNNTYVGAYLATHYDPRYRGFYTITKTKQQAIWTDPYVFYSLNQVGLTYSKPIYDTINSPIDNTTTQLFQGVIAVDILLGEFQKFLTTQYAEDDMLVLVLESKEPHYLIAASTGTPSNNAILQNEPTKPCPNKTRNPECDVVRVAIDHLDSQLMDLVLRSAFFEQKSAGFPNDILIPVRVSDSVGAQAYFSQGQPYKHRSAKNLEWYIVVVMPIARSPSDAVVLGDPLFVVVCIFASLGAGSCFTLFLLFYRKRKEPAVANADWRFTCAFILGCSLLNLSSFTLLGDNTYPTCLLRMWTFNALFVCALAPLLVKVWRMNKLLEASAAFRRMNVTHIQALLYTLPFIGLELTILAIFSFVDRPKPVESLSTGQQAITCQQETPAFFATQLLYDGCLIIVGCVLAYKTRDVDPKYGEAKQLVFSMYNIAFTGFVTVLIFRLVMLDQSSKIVVQTLGVLWGTFFCSFAFVLPRFIEVANTRRRISSTDFCTNIEVSTHNSRPTGKLSSSIEQGSTSRTSFSPISSDTELSVKIDEILTLLDKNRSNESQHDQNLRRELLQYKRKDSTVVLEQSIPEINADCDDGRDSHDSKE